tara:strand:- start:361 stop:1185 length:825 start_codon:yes stop_codon:yes gene_type:complete
MRAIKENSCLGASIEGIDLTKPLSDKEVSFISNSLAEYEVIFFKNQRIEPSEHREFALNFGSLQTHPAYPTVDGYPEITILENDRDNPSKIEEWHTDMTFREIPPLGSILIGRIVPPKVGATLFGSLSKAYESLPEKMKLKLGSLSAVHSFEYGFKESLAEPGGRERLKQALIDNPPVTHPVIRTHPITGRKSIFVNKLFTSHINEVNEEESKEILRFLFEHIKKDEFLMKFEWEKDFIAFWDNRSILHKPDNDYWPQHRKMERITIDDTLRPS